MKTGYLAAGLLAIALLAPTGVAAPLENQIDNEGFEDWADGDPVEWRVLEGPVSETSKAAEDQSAAKFSVKGTDLKSAIAQNVSLDREDAPIAPAQEYDFDFQAKLGQGSSDAPTSEGIVIWKNALGEEVDRDTVEVSPDSSYSLYENTFRAPVDATEAEIQFSLTRDNPTQQTDAEFFVDAVAFGPSNPAE